MKRWQYQAGASEQHADLWRKVLRAMRAWLDLQEQNISSAEDEEFLMDAEWAAVRATKAWLDCAGKARWNVSDLSEGEAEAFDHLVLQSQQVHYDSTEALPFSVTLFMPWAFWNDDPFAPDDDLRPTEKLSLLHSLAPSLETFLLQRLRDSWIRPDEPNRYDVRCWPGWHETRVRRAMVDANDQDLTRPDRWSEVQLLALTDTSEGDWLRAGVIPVMVRSESYGAICDLTFDEDGGFDRAILELESDRTKCAPPMGLMDAVAEASRCRWDLWAEAILTSPGDATMALRNTQFVVQIHQDTPCNVKVMVQDLDSSGKVLHSWQAERALETQEDWRRALAPWTMRASTSWRWSVQFETIDRLPAAALPEWSAPSVAAWQRLPGLVLH